MEGRDLLSEVRAALESGLAAAEGAPAARGAVALRKSFDKVMEQLAQIINAPFVKETAHETALATAATEPSEEESGELALAAVEVERLREALQASQDECERLASTASSFGVSTDTSIYIRLRIYST